MGKDGETEGKLIEPRCNSGVYNRFLATPIFMKNETLILMKNENLILMKKNIVFSVFIKSNAT